MSSEKRIVASRANGAKSHGPKTPEGKRVSSLNALKHGLTAVTPVIRAESVPRYQELLDAFIQEYEPRTATELSLVSSLALYQWRSQRLWDIETAALNLEMEAIAADNERCFEKLDNATRTALAFQSLERNSGAISLNLRYESRMRRHFERALDRLQQRRAQRYNKNLPNEPRSASESTPPLPEGTPDEPGTDEN